MRGRPCGPTGHARSASIERRGGLFTRVDRNHSGSNRSPSASAVAQRGRSRRARACAFCATRADLQKSRDRHFNRFASDERHRCQRNESLATRGFGFCAQDGMTGDERQEELRRRLFALGFDDVRFASTAESLENEGLSAWLKSGMHGDMAWMERSAAKRLDPAQVLEGVKSIILLGVSYAFGAEEAVSDRPVWARYALH